LERQRTRLAAGEGVRSTTPDGPFVLGGVVTLLDVDTATAVVCVVDDAELYDLETGEQLAAAAQINLNRTDLRRDAGQWLVANSVQEAFFGREEEERCISALP